MPSLCAAFLGIQIMVAEDRRVGEPRVTGIGWGLSGGSRAWWLPAWTLALDCLVQMLASLCELICLRCLEQCLDGEVYIHYMHSLL